MLTDMVWGSLPATKTRVISDSYLEILELWNNFASFILAYPQSPSHLPPIKFSQVCMNLTTSLCLNRLACPVPLVTKITSFGFHIYHNDITEDFFTQ